MPGTNKLTMQEPEKLALVGKALSSLERIKILNLLENSSFSVLEISEKLKLPASTTGIHVKVLEKADLINTEIQPGNRGTLKICSKKFNSIDISLRGASLPFDRVIVTEMPIGYYTNCRVYPTCGLASEISIIGREDYAHSFYNPKRIEAQIIWLSSGFLEYKFPYELEEGVNPKKLEFSAEICSEAPNYRNDWKSEITLWLNGIDCGTYLSMSDYGDRKGLLNPNWWENGSTQYGMLVKWSITKDGCYINDKKVHSNTLNKLELSGTSCVDFKIGIKNDAKFKGGINIFGKKFGDYSQDIIMKLVY